MTKNKIAFLFFFLMNHCLALPDPFVYLSEVDPSIIQEMKYFSDDNFIGRHINGYEAAQCILTKPAAEALAKVQQELKKESLSLKVYDCYRPATAVKDFISWSEDLSDQKNKNDFYPNVNKTDLFTLGYIAAKSGHTRGSTVDLTIVRLEPGQPPQTLDMGTHFDFMDERSHALSEKIPGQQHENRMILRNAMQNAGFLPYEYEWWHFWLNQEPFPEAYFIDHPRFDFPVA